MVLYIRQDCAYCQRVLDAAEQLGVVFDLRDISDPEMAEELEHRGGKIQVPYLVDEDEGVEMYESDDIIEYLQGVADVAEARTDDGEDMLDDDDDDDLVGFGIVEEDDSDERL